MGAFFPGPRFFACKNKTMTFFSFLNIFFLFVLLYQLCWALFSVLPVDSSGCADVNYMAVLIPAHNEEKVIFKTVKQCFEQGIKFVFVVADNCSDNTIKEAIRAGAVVYTVSMGGKQLCLPWLCNLILDRYRFIKKFVFLDADSLVGPDYFRKISYNLDLYPVVQSCLNVKNFRGVVPGWYALNYDFLNLFVFRPRSNMGRGALTGGTGWACRRQVLLDVPFKVSSLVDDLEYSLKLRLAGVSVRYLPSVSVYDEKPTNFWGSNIQRTRWVRGTTEMLLKYGFKVFLKDFDIFFLSSWTFLGLLNFPLIVYSLFHSPIYFFVYQYCFLAVFLIPLLFFKHRISIIAMLLFPFFNLLNFLIIIYGTLTYKNKKWVRTVHKFNFIFSESARTLRG